MKTFFLSWLKLSLCYFGLLIVAYVVCLVVVWHGLRPIQHIESEDFAEELAAEGPLVPSTYIDSLNYLSLKEKSYELVRAYNRRAHIIQIVRQRMQMLRRLGKVSTSVEKVVERNLDMMEQDNKQIMRHYERIVAFAEVQHAQSFLKSHSPDAEEKARLFAKENQQLLDAVEVPMSFK